jgi:hypothetical protein
VTKHSRLYQFTPSRELVQILYKYIMSAGFLKTKYRMEKITAFCNHKEKIKSAIESINLSTYRAYQPAELTRT